MNTVVIILNSVFVRKQLITGVHGAVQDPAVAVARGGENVVPSTSKAVRFASQPRDLVV